MANFNLNLPAIQSRFELNESALFIVFFIANTRLADCFDGKDGSLPFACSNHRIGKGERDGS
jgi:hypothetical protein